MTHAERIAAIRERVLNKYPSGDHRSFGLGDDLEQRQDDAEYLLARVEALEAALGEAIESIESWGGYVPDYFKDKHNLQGDINRLTAIKEGRDE